MTNRDLFSVELLIDTIASSTTYLYTINRFSVYRSNTDVLWAIKDKTVLNAKTISDLKDLIVYCTK